MRVNVIAIVPPSNDEIKMRATPEILASSLAKYSRSNLGIESIIDSIDWNDTDSSVDKIFKFIDYGHASIGGMTGGIPITVDDCSMFLAYKIFEISSLVDGQESSTRYIKMESTDSLIPFEDTGIPLELKSEWDDLMLQSFKIYDEYYKYFDNIAQHTPDVMRIPKTVNEKVANRIRKNYALDRARYFIPLATKTSAAYIMTARVWAETIKKLASYNIPELQNAANLIRNEVSKVAPRMMKHSYPDDASIYHANSTYNNVMTSISKQFNTKCIDDEVYVNLYGDTTNGEYQYMDLGSEFYEKTNRYSTVGDKVKRVSSRFSLNNIAIAELRDLNRHRSGFKYCDLSPVGFYFPYDKDIDNDDLNVWEKYSKFFDMWEKFMIKLGSYNSNASFMYGYLLGTQVGFEHTQQLDKLIYEIELRTGLGAHFRYAEHLKSVAKVLYNTYPEYEPYINIGTAEPE